MPAVQGYGSIKDVGRLPSYGLDDVESKAAKATTTAFASSSIRTDLNAQEAWINPSKSINQSLSPKKKEAQQPNRPAPSLLSRGGEVAEEWAM